MSGETVVYSVRCEFTDAAVAAEWRAWLRKEHLADVCAAGARSATIHRVLGTERPTYEIRYRFDSLADFERYEREAAPRLRAEGLSRFPLSLGLSYSRSVTAEEFTFEP